MNGNRRNDYTAILFEANFPFILQLGYAGMEKNRYPFWCRLPVAFYRSYVAIRRIAYALGF
jgi:hypothetical protein